MKRILLIFSAVLMAAAVAAGLWFNASQVESVDNSKWLSRPFNGVRSIHIQSVEGAYMLKPVNDAWEAHVPGASWNIEARALPGRVTDYLNKLGAMTPIRSVGGLDRGPDEYGLDEPSLKIIVALGDKDEDKVSIKLAADESGTVYGWNSDSPALVYEFDAKVMGQYALPASHFLDKRVFNFDVEKVDKLQLVQTFGSSWLVEKHKEGFFFAQPGYLQGKPASDSELKLYIHSLDLLQAGKLVLEPVVTDNRIPALSIRLWSEKRAKPDTVEFFTLKDAPGAYLGKSSWLTVPFTLDAQSVSQLVRSAFDVQGRTVVKLDTGAVARLIVANGDTYYAVERGKQGWRVLGSPKELQGIDMFLWRFTELQFEALPLNNLPDSAFQLMHCKLVDEKGSTLTEITFYADPNLPQGQCWMKNGGDMYYPVSSRLLKDLQGMFPVVVKDDASSGEKS